MRVAFIRYRKEGKPTPVWVFLRRHDDISFAVKKAPAGTDWILSYYLMDPREIAPGRLWAWRGTRVIPSKDGRPLWGRVSQIIRDMLQEMDTNDGWFTIPIE